MACVVCRQLIGQESAQRRLDSPSAVSVKLVLSEVVNGLHFGTAQMLLSDNSVACCICFRLARKLVKLRKKVADKEAKLIEAMKSAVEEIAASISLPPCTPNPQITLNGLQGLNDRDRQRRQKKMTHMCHGFCTRCASLQQDEELQDC